MYITQLLLKVINKHLRRSIINLDLRHHQHFLSTAGWRPLPILKSPSFPELHEMILLDACKFLDLTTPSSVLHGYSHASPLLVSILSYQLSVGYLDFSPRGPTTSIF